MKSFLQYIREALEPSPLTKLAKLLRPTKEMDRTGFLLPDGTRLDLGGYNMHSRAALASGTTLAEVLKAGALRYTAHYGVELGSKMTSKQAQIVADDWIFYAMDGSATSLSVDVTDERGNVIKSREFEEDFTPSALRNWANAQIHE